CACLWSCPWEPPPAGPTAIIAGPNGWRHSRSCSAMQALLMEAAHWGLALIPVLVLLAVFDWLDAFELVNLREILVLLLLGGIAAGLSWPVSGRLLDTLPIGFSIYSRFIAPWIEEAIKGAMIIALFRMNRIGYKLDAVIAGFAIGAGFSVVENIIYLVRFPDYGAGTWLVRGFGTAVMHGATLAVLAAIAHEFAERGTRGAASDFDFHFWWFVPGYLAAVALHMGFNQFPARPPRRSRHSPAASTPKAASASIAILSSRPGWLPRPRRRWWRKRRAMPSSARAKCVPPLTNSMA